MQRQISLWAIKSGSRYSGQRFTKMNPRGEPGVTDDDAVPRGEVEKEVQVLKSKASLGPGDTKQGRHKLNSRSSPHYLRDRPKKTKNPKETWSLVPGLSDKAKR